MARSLLGMLPVLLLPITSALAQRPGELPRVGVLELASEASRPPN